MNEPSPQLDHGDAPWTRRRMLRYTLGVIGSALVAMLPVEVRGQEAEVLLPEKECQVKYALLYSFGLLTTWPAEAFDPPESGPFVIGMLGTKPFPEYLARIAESKKIQGRKIAIRQFQTAEEAKRCHILYVTSAAPPEAEKAIARKFAGQPVLVVSERTSEKESEAGMIVFLIEQGAVKFLLNADAARAHHLQIDPRLLKLAKRPASPPQSTPPPERQRP